MRKTGAALLVVLLLAALPVSARRRAVTPGRPAPPSPYLQEALGAAAWLTSLERPSGANGLAWPDTPGRQGLASGIATGAAGIGAYFLRLHRSTGDATALAKAEGAARFIMAEYRAGRFAGHDWLGGAAGTGDYLLELHATTRNPEYLDAARMAGDFLLGNAVPANGGLHWKHYPTIENIYTGLAHGAAGVGLFLVRLYDETKDARYLDAAEGAYRWLTAYDIDMESALHAVAWKRLTVDSVGYTGWCGGAAGIAPFLDELHRVTGKTEYLDAWRATVEGLYAGATRARQSPLEYGWGHAPNSRVQSLGVIYCHGTAGNAVIVAEAASRTADARYHEMTAGAGRWLDRIAVPAPAGAYWPHFVGSPLFERGLLTGTAAVGHASLRLYALTNDETHLQRAVKAADYLLAVADHPAPGQSRWLNRTDTSEPAEYRTGWYTGAAGIGIFLLELHDTLQGRLLSSRFSSLNP